MNLEIQSGMRDEHVKLYLERQAIKVYSKRMQMTTFIGQGDKNITIIIQTYETIQCSQADDTFTLGTLKFC